MDLPRLIHFVWAGGEVQMPRANLERVILWAIQHVDFKVFIWTDPSSIFEGMCAIQAHFESAFGARVVSNIEIRDINKDLLSFAKVNFAESFIRYEIERLRPNYGASSDMIRYAALFIYGGAYFDSDILPGGESLDERHTFGELEGEAHQFYVDGRSQNTNNIGNDAFISTKENPIALQLLKLSCEHYNADYFQGVMKKPFYLFYDRFKDIRALTPNITGPDGEGRSIALAVLRNGQSRHGETITVPLMDGRMVKALVTEPIFFDKEGERTRG